MSVSVLPELKRSKTLMKRKMQQWCQEAASKFTPYSGKALYHRGLTCSVVADIAEKLSRCCCALARSAVQRWSCLVSSCSLAQYSLGEGPVACPLLPQKVLCFVSLMLCRNLAAS